MQGDIIRASVVCKKMIPNVSPDLARILKLKPEHKSIGLITGSIDDVTFIAMDEATKMADVEVAYGECTFSCLDENFTHFAGEAIGILAGTSPAEVASGLDACVDFIENGTAYYINGNDAGESIYMAHCISATGNYLSESCGVAPGTPMGYLIAPPIEQFYALDAALKAADVRVVKEFLPPLNTCNFGGALVVGTQAACKAACEAFEQACIYVANNPLK